MPRTPTKSKSLSSIPPGPEEISELEELFKGVQDHICSFIASASGQDFGETTWDYENGTGGGRTRVWEVNRHGDVNEAGEWALKPQDTPLPFFEKGACNLSIIEGNNMPDSAAEHLKIPKGKPYKAMGVSLIFHPSNPWVPTTHANVRFFYCDGKWWFGGGVDVTPYYPNIAQTIEFHQKLSEFCSEHGMNYELEKDACDKYFFLRHRKECRGIGGIFFDHLHGQSFEHARDFTIGLGRKFTELYAPFMENATLPFTQAQREFQLYRRGRYVEFNLLFDRGTKFGISSDGRAESILCSLPATVHWTADYTPPEGSMEAYLYQFFLRPQDWINLTDDEIAAMAPPAGYWPEGVGAVQTMPKANNCCSALVKCDQECVVSHVALLGGLLVAFAAYKFFKDGKLPFVKS